MTMFRLYLMNRLKEGLEDSEGDTPRGYIDRRKHQRFSVKEKKILVSNKEDLLFIQNVSKEGFNTETSERTFERIKVGDIYECRLRYRGESYTCQAKVRWKKDLFVGFSVENPESKIKEFFSRLILPQKVASSIKKIQEESALEELSENVTWYLGEKETHIVLFHIGAKTKWFVKTKEFILFYNLEDLFALKEERALDSEMIKFLFSNDKNLKSFAPKQDHLILVQDIVMASSIEEREKLLEDLSGNEHSEVRLFKSKH